MRYFSAAEEIAKQDARMAHNRDHFASQENRVANNDVAGFWRAELDFRRDMIPKSRESEVWMAALRQLVIYLEDQPHV